MRRFWGAMGALALSLTACGGGGGIGEVCGNGVITGNEVCDGTALAGETCESLGYSGGTLACLGNCSDYDTSGCTGTNCGDDAIGGDEVCDGVDLDEQTCETLGYDGGTLGCASDCLAYETSHCTGNPCGNGHADLAEACDGDDLKSQSCESQGFAGGTLACAADCTAFDTSECYGCGDAAITGTEVCDGTALSGQDCISQGFDGGTLGCLSDCSGFDTTGCFRCGDGVITGPEVCDGSTLGGVSCTDFGFTGGTLYCNATCDDYDRGSCTGAGCGNGFVEPGEVCDGNAVGGLSCTDFGFTAGTLVCNLNCDGFDTAGCGNPTCGNDTAEVGEACDGLDLQGQDCVSLGLGFTGGTLGCDTSCEYDMTACTAATAPGSDCTNAGVIDPALLPVTLAGVTTGAGDDYTASNNCPGIPQNEGAGHPDVAYSLTPTTDGVYTFEYTPDFDGTLYVVTDCTDVGNNCLGASEWGGAGDTEQLQLSLTAGTPYYVILDGGLSGGGAVDGAYTLVVSGPCVPSCTGVDCGSDGCGGFCGPCTGGDVCDVTTQTCVAQGTATGDDCSSAITIPGVPYTTTGFTAGTSDDYNSAFGCPGPIGNQEGQGSGDVAYVFTPTTTGFYTVEYTPDFDGAVYVVSDCGNVQNTCLGGSEDGNAWLTETVEVQMDAGTDYFIIVDGGFGGQEGNYTLSLRASCLPDCANRDCGTDGCGGSCGDCTGGDVCDDSTGTCADPSLVVGEDCGNAHVVDPAGLPYVNVDDTTGSTDSYNAATCPGPIAQDEGDGSGDHAYEFTPTSTAYYDISVDSVGWNASFYVVTDCADVAGTCVYGEGDSNGGELQNLLLDAGTSYYIIVDGQGNFGTTEGLYELQISQPTCTPDCQGKACGDDGCGGSCGDCQGGEICDSSSYTCVDPANATGNTCANAIVVGSVPYTDSGYTDPLSFTDDYAANNGACDGLQYGGGSSPDVAYSFTPTTAGIYTIGVTPANYASFYVVTDCGNIQASCLGGDYTNGTLAELTVALDAGTPYYIIVDGGHYQTTYGDYTLDISAPCTPSCGCGTDGCGGYCPACTSDVCDPGTNQCTALGSAAGQTCPNAVAISPASLPAVVSGDTTGSDNDYNHGGGVCPGENQAHGALGADNVFSFTPTTAGDYTITLNVDGWNGQWYIVTDCGNIGNTCVYSQEDAGPGGSESNTVTLAAGTTYYIIVDSDFTVGGVGAYELVVE